MIYISGNRIELVFVIVVICFLTSEVYDYLFKKKKIYKLKLVIVSFIGGIIGILIWLTNPEVIFNVKNIWESIAIGIISGAGSCEIKNIIKKNKENRRNK